MTKYIKGKDGKFQGSIGSGKTSVPTAAPQPVTAPAISQPDSIWENYTPPGRLTEDDVPYYIDSFTLYPERMQEPDRELDIHLPFDDDTVASWPVPRPQRELDEDLATMTRYIRTLDTEFESHGGLMDLMDTFAWKAGLYRDSGYHHMARAYDWGSETGHQVISVDSYIVNNMDEIDMDAIIRDRRKVSQGAALMDVLPKTQGDVDAAAVMLELLPKVSLDD